MLIPPPYAIDLGDRAVRIAQLAPRQRWHAGYPTPRLRFVIERDLPEGWVVAGTIADPEPLAQLIRRAIDTTTSPLSRSPFVVTALPERRTFLTTVAISEGTAGEPNELRRAIAAALPTEMGTMASASAPIPGAPDRIAVAAAPTALVESHASLFERAHLTPITFVTEAEALARAVAYATSTSTGEPKTTHHSTTQPLNYSTAPTLILDLGATRTGAIVAHGPAVAASVTLPVSGTSLTAAIAAKLKVESQAAERTKRVTDLARASQDDPAATALAGALEPLVHGLDALRAFAAHHLPPSLRPARIVLTGGGANMIGLDAFLQTKTKLPVTRFDLPVHVLNPNARTSGAPSQAPSLALVFGLGLIALDPASAVTGAA